MGTGFIFLSIAVVTLATWGGNRAKEESLLKQYEEQARMIEQNLLENMDRMKTVRNALIAYFAAGYLWLAIMTHTTFINPATHEGYGTKFSDQLGLVSGLTRDKIWQK